MGFSLGWFPVLPAVCWNPSSGFCVFLQTNLPTDGNENMNFFHFARSLWRELETERILDRGYMCVVILQTSRLRWTAACLHGGVCRATLWSMLLVHSTISWLAVDWQALQEHKQRPVIFSFFFLFWKKPFRGRSSSTNARIYFTLWLDHFYCLLHACWNKALNNFHSNNCTILL